MNFERPDDEPKRDQNETELPVEDGGAPEIEPPVDEPSVAAGDIPTAVPASDASDSNDSSPTRTAPDGLTVPLVDGRQPAPSTPDWNSQIDFSTWEPAPGYADPVTGKMRSRPLGYSPLDSAVRDLAEGRGKPWQPQAGQGIFEPPSSLPVRPMPQVGGAEPSPSRGSAGGVPGQVAVNLQVELADKVLDRISTSAAGESSRKAKEAMRGLAQRLSEFIDEQRRLERARRTTWGR